MESKPPLYGVLWTPNLLWRIMPLMRALPTPRTYADIKATRKMRWWYESLADVMITNPQMTQNELAQHFGRTAPTIAIIVNSDAFKAYMRQRRNDLAESLDQSVRAKLFKLTGDTLDVMIDKIDKKKDTIPLSELNRTTEMALKALGYTSEKPSVVVNQAAPQTTVIVPVSLQDLQEAQSALRASQRQSPMIDVTPEEPIIEAAE